MLTHFKAETADDVFFRGTYRIAIAPLGRDFAAIAAFYGVVGSQNDRRPWGHKDREEQPEQHLTALAR
jgi:hypothetical protein